MSQKPESLEEHLQKIVDNATEEAKRKFHELVHKAAESDDYFPGGIDMRRYFHEIKDEKAKIEAAKVKPEKVEPKVEEPKAEPKAEVKPAPKRPPAKKPAAKRAPRKKSE